MTESIATLAVKKAWFCYQLADMSIQMFFFVQVWKHGKRRSEDTGGSKEVFVRGAVSGFWGEYWMSTVYHVFFCSPHTSYILISIFWHLLKFLCFLFFFWLVQNRYNQAKLSIHDRALKVAAVVESLEREMELLCLTGVEDQLQADVRPTLEQLRNAGIKVS